MSIFKRIYGRRIPATKMDAESPAVGETTTETPAAVVATTTTTGGEETTTPTTTTTTEAATTTTETVVVTPVETAATAATNGDVPNVTTTTSNGAPRSFQFGAKAKMFRDMLTQHRLKLDSDQTQILCIIGMLALALVCSLGAIGTNYWQSEGDQHYGLWNTCQTQTTLTLPETNSTDNTTTTLTTTVMCLHHNAQNQLEMVRAEPSRIDQVQAAQGLIVCGTIMYAASLVALVFAYRFIKTKPSRSLNMMRNLLVTAIFTQILSFLLQLIGFFLYILTERISTSVGLLFVYFGLALFATNIINFITIEYKAYKMRQQQVQIN